MRTTLFCAAMAAVAQATTNHWAVIVAGSNGYYNYRHQADAAHAYQIMKKNGISDDHIILMMYDDVRYNRSNPLPGKLFNRTDGPDVAQNLKIDYSGRDVTPENFLAVLKGDAASATGPVLNSDANSKVFVYFTDHGAPGLVAFPNDVLYADDLQDAFDVMTANKAFKEMVVYIEACESGSMFPYLESDSNIFGLTASNASQSSWASYCGSEAYVNGTYIGSCLGDLFSTNWMEDSDIASHMFGETLAEQAAVVTKLTSASPVQQFGDKSFQSEPIGNFQSNLGNNLLKSAFNKTKAKFEKKNIPKSENHVSSRDVKLDYLYNKLTREQTNEAGFELQEEIAYRQKVDNIFNQLFEGQNSADVMQPTNFDCLRFLMGTYKEHCGEWEDYSLKHVRHLSNHCETASGFEVFEVASKMRDICQ